MDIIENETKRKEKSDSITCNCGWSWNRREKISSNRVWIEHLNIHVHNSEMLWVLFREKKIMTAGKYNLHKAEVVDSKLMTLTYLLPNFSWKWWLIMTKIHIDYDACSF